MVDPGAIAYYKIMDDFGNPAEVTEHGELKTATVSLLAYDQVEGNALNTNMWTPSSSTMTIVQSNSFLTVNNNASTTANAYALITSNKVFPFYGEQEVELSTSILINGLPDANEIIEFGLMTAATNVAPTDGVFFRITNGLTYGVVSFGGVETVQQLTGFTANVIHDCDIGIDSFNCEFEIDGARTTVAVPSTLPFPTATARQPLIYRVRNTSGTPVAGIKLQIGRMEIVQALITVNKPWPELLCELGRSSVQSPVSAFGVTTNQANNTVPATATLSNTTPGYASTILDGNFKFASPAGAETDYVLFAYQIPSGYQFKVGGVQISTWVDGTAVVTATVLSWAIGNDATAASLATTDGTGTTAPRKTALGAQSFAASAAIGSLGQDIDRKFSPPLICNSGRWLTIIVRVPQGAATASLNFRGSVKVQGFFE